MGRKEGSGGIEILIEGPKPRVPRRLLINSAWQLGSAKVPEENMDMIADAFWSEFGANQILLAEVRIRAQCSSGKPHAGSWFRDSMFRETDLDSLGGKLAYAGARLEIQPHPSAEFWDSPKREISLEVLREDPRDIYMDIMSQWQRLPGAGPSWDLLATAKPSEFIQAAVSYTRSKVLGLFAEGNS